VAGSDDPRRWQDAAERWRALERPFPTAYARYREAAAILGSRGSGTAAADALRSAHEAASGLEARPLVERIERLAGQARIALEGDRPEPETTDGPSANPYGLTAREHEVLELVAAGWTNQRIADRLVITRKTASVHVSNVMAKLGVANRGEAAAMARSVGLVGDDLLSIGRG